MSCREIESRLDGLLEGTLSSEERRRLEDHLDACEGCRDLHAAARASLDVLPRTAEVDLTDGVLHRTSGSACGRAREHLPDLVSRELGEADAELVRGHVSHCEPCASLQSALEMTAELLPEMAEVDPGPWFTAEVVRGAHSRRRAGWWHRLEDWWSGLLERPRLAWEGAYVGALIAVLLFGTPLSPMRGVPAQALELARANPMQVVKAGMSPLPAVGARIADYSGRVWDATGGAVVDGTRPARQALGRKVGSAWDTTFLLRQHGAQGWDAILDGNFEGLGASLREMGQDLKIMWIRLTTPDPETAGGKPGSKEV